MGVNLHVFESLEDKNVEISVENESLACEVSWEAKTVLGLYVKNLCL